MSKIFHAAEFQGREFDNFLWLNDVAFSVRLPFRLSIECQLSVLQAEDALALLSTNNVHYAAACSLNFSKPPLYYDTFALRDERGRKTVSQVWPYFSPGKSRDALLAEKPVPVKSCWNGMIAMDAGLSRKPSHCIFVLYLICWRNCIWKRQNVALYT